MTDLKIETILGEVVSKANHYQSVPCSRSNPHGERRLIKDKAIRNYERSFAEQCKVYRDANISTPFIFRCKVYYTSWASDLDNSLKTILDCLQYCKCISNDNLCVQILAAKAIDRKRPRVEFAIQPIQQQLNF